MERPDFDMLVVEDPMSDTASAAIARRLRRYCPRLQLVRICEGRRGKHRRDRGHPAVHGRLPDWRRPPRRVGDSRRLNARLDDAPAADGDPVNDKQQDRAADGHQPAG